MTLAGWLAALAVGLLAGGVSGLVGIGGGAIMVPFLYFFLMHPELSGVHVAQAEQAVIAHATSLAVIVPISLRGAWLYHKAGLVEWRSVWKMGAASVVAAVLGARVAVAVPGELLKAAFGVFLLAAAVQLLLGKRGSAIGSGQDARAHTARAIAGGAAVGFLAALLGVGGGLVAIPVLIYGLRLPLKQVSATSLAIVTITASAGVVAYAVSGWLSYSNPSGALAYINVPAGLALALGALVAVRFGTGIQRRMPTHALRWVFALLFFALGARITVVSLLDAALR